MKEVSYTLMVFMFPFLLSQDFFFSLVSSTVSIPNAGHSDCSRDCVPQYTAWDDSALLVLCCDSHDMCNDVGASVDEYIASIQQNSSE